MSATLRTGHNQAPFKLLLAALWLLLSIALASWWLIFGLRQVERFSQLQNDMAAEFARQHSMLMWEGGFLIVLLLAGGCGLIYYVYTERRQQNLVRGFFASFTHDLRTSLASLRLQAESLEEDSNDPAQSKLLQRLVKDTVRLELQLENSLSIADAGAAQLHFENVSMETLLLPVRHHWPELQIAIEPAAARSELRVDVRAAESILKNLVQNAVIHGKATRLEFSVRPDGDRLEVSIEDNGQGFKGDLDRLGEMFVRHGTRSGSGTGLYLAKTFAGRLGGSLEFEAPIQQNQPRGFRARWKVPGRLAEKHS